MEKGGEAFISAKKIATEEGCRGSTGSCVAGDEPGGRPGCLVQVRLRPSPLCLVGYAELGLLGFSEFCVDSWNGDSPLRVEMFFSYSCSLLRAPRADAWMRQLDPGMGNKPDLGQGGVSVHARPFRSILSPSSFRPSPDPYPGLSAGSSPSEGLTWLAFIRQSVAESIPLTCLRLEEKVQPES